jgi:hypothetical protein
MQIGGRESVASWAIVDTDSVVRRLDGGTIKANSPSARVDPRLSFTSLISQYNSPPQRHFRADRLPGSSSIGPVFSNFADGEALAENAYRTRAEPSGQYFR